MSKLHLLCGTISTNQTCICKTVQAISLHYTYQRQIHSWIHIFPYLRQAKYYKDYFLINNVQLLLFFQSVLKIPAIDTLCCLVTLVDITWERVMNVVHHPPPYIYQMTLILIEMLICILTIEKHSSKMYLKIKAPWEDPSDKEFMRELSEKLTPC